MRCRVACSNVAVTVIAMRPLKYIYIYVYMYVVEGCGFDRHELKCVGKSEKLGYELACLSSWL